MPRHLPSLAASCVLGFCAGFAFQDLSAQIGTFTMEYRMADANLTLTGSSIFPAPNGVGSYVTGTYDNEDGDSIAWVMRLDQGGGVVWSFAATEPLPRAFFTLDRADNLIVRRYHVAEDRTEIVKYDPKAPEAPVYAREMDGDQRFADDTLVFEPDAMYVAANLNGRIQLGRLADSGEWVWAKEYTIHSPESESVKSSDNEAVEAPVSAVRIFSDNVSPLPRKRIHFSYEIFGNVPERAAANIARVDAGSGVLEKSFSASGPPGFVDTAARGQRTGVFAQGNHGLESGERRFVRFDLDSVSIEAVQLTGYPLISLGVPFSNGSHIVYRSEVPRQDGAGTRAGLVVFGPDLEMTCAIGLSATSDPDLRNRFNSGGPIGPRQFATNITLVDGVLNTGSVDVVFDLSTLDAGNPAGRVLEKAPKPVFRTDSFLRASNCQAAVLEWYRASVQNPTGLENVLRLIQLNAFAGSEMEGFSTPIQPLDAEQLAVTATYLDLFEVECTATANNLTDDENQVFAIHSVIPGVDPPVAELLWFWHRVSQAFDSTELPPLRAALTDDGKFQAKLTANQPMVVQLEGTTDLPAGFQLLDILNVGDEETLEFLRAILDPYFFIRARLATPSPDNP